MLRSSWNAHVSFQKYQASHLESLLETHVMRGWNILPRSLGTLKSLSLTSAQLTSMVSECLVPKSLSTSFCFREVTKLTVSVLFSGIFDDLCEIVFYRL